MFWMAAILCVEDGELKISRSVFKLVSVGKPLCLSLCAMSCSRV